MSKFQLGDEVYFGSNCWCGYTVVAIKPNSNLDVMISPNGSVLSGFWVSSKDLNFIV